MVQILPAELIFQRQGVRQRSTQDIPRQRSYREVQTQVAGHPQLLGHFAKTQRDGLSSMAGSGRQLNDMQCSETQNSRTILVDAQMGPASIPSDRLSISIMHTPVSLSPLRIACCIGAAPLYAGRSEGWTLSLLDCANRFNILLGRMRPNDAVIIT